MEHADRKTERKKSGTGTKENVNKTGRKDEDEDERWQEREEVQTGTYMTSFYLAEYDVDYTADHHQSIEDVPRVPDIALSAAACTASGRRGGGRRGAGRREG